MKIMIVLTVVLLAGCQVLSYSPPLSGDAATVIFTSNNTAAQPVVCVPGSGFQGTETTLAHKPFASHAFDAAMKTMKKADTVTIPVHASDHARIGVVYNHPDSRTTHAMDRDVCKVAVQFDARSGITYKADFIHSNGQCGLSVNGEDGVSANAVPVNWRCPR